MQPKPACEICTDITERHRQAMKEYRTSVALTDGLLGQPGFKEAAERAETARARYYEIREELRKHTEEHGH